MPLCVCSSSLLLPLLMLLPASQLCHQHACPLCAPLPTGILTTRDGYTVGLTASLRLPRFFAAHSARPKPTFWLCGDLSIGMADYSLLVLFWLGTFAMKLSFDYFVLWKVRCSARASWLLHLCINKSTLPLNSLLPSLCLRVRSLSPIPSACCSTTATCGCHATASSSSMRCP
jgi:hypothetical protein